MRWRKGAFPPCWRAAFLLALLSSTAARCADRESSLTNPMPSMLEGVRIGMSDQELQRLRPTVERFEIFGEPEVQADDPDPLYIENLPHSPFFDSVSYAFCARRLCSVALTAAGRGEPFFEREARILQGAMRKWGSHPERLLSLGDDIPGVEVPRYKYPALLWRIDGLHFLLTFSPAPEAGRRQTDPQQPPAISLSIFEPALLKVNMRQAILKALVPVPSGEEARLFELLGRPVEPPFFE